MLLKIITPEKVALEEEIDQVTLETKEGQITILPNHEQLVSLLVPGEAIVKHGSIIQPLALAGGIIHVREQEVLVLSDTAERVEEIIVEQAEEATKRAEKLLTEKQLDAEEYAFVAAKLDRDLNRLRIAKKWKHRTHHTMHLEQ